VTRSPNFFDTEPWVGGVIGLGYVGIPLLVELNKSGLEVVGYDLSRDRIEILNSGSSPVEDVTDDQIKDMLESGAIFTQRTEDLKNVDVIFICVPSPLSRDHEPDLSYIRDAVDTVIEVIRPGMAISLESTSYPGTTEEIVLPALESLGLVLDSDVWVAFSPERVSPGGSLSMSRIPKIVGGVSAESTEVVTAIYRRFIEEVHPVSSSSVAEMAKLLENTYRSINIGLMNEMAQVAHELDIDIWEVIDAAATKPFGFEVFYPGPGVGGHCIPLDPQFLAWSARKADCSARFIDLADQINAEMPVYVADRVIEALDCNGGSLAGTKILGVGIAYKPNISDCRESASVAVLEELERRGAEVFVLDPVVGRASIERIGFKSVQLDDDFSSYSIAVVLTDHDVFDLEQIAAIAPVVFDTRGAYRRSGLTCNNVVTL